MDQPRTDKLSRGFDHLGEIAKTLGDLRGTRTLIHELIQNADDAPGATRLRFVVRDEHLEVWNDGEFTRCTDLGTDECELLPTLGYRCDFHSFRSMGSGDKRNRPGTTGAFGIGFTAVYQVTDRPELISSGEHWIIDETAPAESRIARVDAPVDHAGTTFRLPWAMSASPFRKATRQPPLTKDDVDTLFDELLRTVPLAMPFLKKLQSIEIDGRLEPRLFTRRRPDNRVEVVSNVGDHLSWLILDGDFTERADELKRRFPDQIEEQRSAAVTVAFPLAHSDANGVLYASLPTEESTHLPLLVNAEFFPASDRKRIRVDNAPESMFNRDALRAAARIVATALPELPPLLGDSAVVELLIAARDLSRRVAAERLDTSYQEFWSELTRSLPEAPIVPTADGQRDRLGCVRLWREPEEVAAVEVLRLLDIQLVHPDQRDGWYQLRGGKVDVKELTLDDVVMQLQVAAEASAQAPSDRSAAFADTERLEELWRVIEFLLTSSGRAKQGSRDALRECRIAPGTDGFFWRFDALAATEDATREMLQNAGVSAVFLDADRMVAYPEMGTLVEELDAVRAIELLEEARDEGGIPRTADSGALLRWLFRRSDELSEEDLRRIANLPVFPTGEGLRPLVGLALPGDFEDPLHLAKLVTTDGIENVRPFLHMLGAPRLTFSVYCTEFVPDALEDEGLGSEQRSKVANLIALRLSEIRDDRAVRDALRPLALVQCRDGIWRPAGTVYMSAEVTPVLGPDVHVAVTPPDRRTAVVEMLSWLGVAAEPRVADVVARCREMAAAPPWHRDAARAVVEHLVLRDTRDPEKTRSDFATLRELAWLPAVDDASVAYPPQSLFATFRRFLFSSQARFVDLPLPLQQRASDVLDWLGVPSEPSPSQVVAHLLWCSEQRTEVSKAVWTYLDDNADDPALDALTARDCLLLENGAYVKPGEVYWGGHPFGRWRYTLGPEFRSWQALLDRLDVAETPHPLDAVEVLQDIAAQHGGEKAPLLADDRTVVQHCWSLLSQGLSTGQLSSEDLRELHTDEVVLDSCGWLRTPDEVFFRDSLNLAERFDERLSPRLVERPEGLWPALAAAGVRNLSDAVMTHVVEAVGDSPSGLTIDRLRERRLLMLRVIGDDLDSACRLREFYEAISVRHLTRLEIQQSLDVGDEHFSSAPFPRAALFRADEQVLLCVEGPGIPPTWVEIARELIRALAIERGQPSLAAALKSVLQAETVDDAAAELDELGFPALDAIVIDAVEAGVAGSLGGTTTDVEEPCSESVPAGEQSEETESAGHGAASVAPTGDHVSDDNDSETDSEAPSTANTFVEGVGASDSGGQTEGGGRTREVASEANQTRLRSYVAPAAPGGTAPADSEDDAVERAGVDAVLAYEREHGRVPEEMPPLNPGFDIRSVGEDGAVRIIEVKACRASWGGRGVALSSTQFATAQQRREEFWLYVVENAMTDPKLHAINDPASRVDQYFFDEGWRVTSEPEPVPRPSLHSLQLSRLPQGLADVPFFAPDNEQPGVPGAEDGWLACGRPERADSWFAVRITGYALGLAFYGGVAVVDSNEATPEDGDLVLVALHEQLDTDSGSRYSLRRWAPERDLGGAELALRLASDGSVEPLTVAAPEKAVVLGAVRVVLRADDVEQDPTVDD